MLRGLVSLLCVLVTTTAAAGTAVLGDAPRRPAGATNVPSGTDGALIGAHPRPLPFFYDLYTFRGPAGRTTVVASFSVPAERLQHETIRGEARYRFDVTLVLADTLLRSVFRTDDSVFVRSPHSLPGEHLIHTYIEVQASPSYHTLERVIMSDATTPGIGQLYSAPFLIPDYGGSRLMLSDVVLGQPDPTADWKRGGVSLALLPTSRLPGSSFGVYYEIYNLPSEDRYSTELTIERVDDTGVRVDGGGVVRTRFAGEAAPGPDGSVPELRNVGASLGEGRYRLTVRVTDEDNGQTATRGRIFEVGSWAHGATLVPALPWRPAPPIAARSVTRGTLAQ